MSTGTTLNWRPADLLPDILPATAIIIARDQDDGELLLLPGVFMMTIDTHGKWISEVDGGAIGPRYPEFWWFPEAELVRTLPKVTQ